jgi:hypothetical protein
LRWAVIAKNQYLISTQTLIFRSHDQTWPCNHALETYSRQGAKVAKNLYVWFVLIPDTSAAPAPPRDYIYFFLAEALRPQRTSMFNLLLPKTPLRSLRLGEKKKLQVSGI